MFSATACRHLLETRARRLLAGSKGLSLVFRGSRFLDAMSMSSAADVGREKYGDICMEKEKQKTISFRSALPVYTGQYVPDARIVLR